MCLPGCFCCAALAGGAFKLPLARFLRGDGDDVVKDDVSEVGGAGFRLSSFEVSVSVVEAERFPTDFRSSKFVHRRISQHVLQFPSPPNFFCEGEKLVMNH